MTNRLIYLAGQPGSGKSTLMRRLTEGVIRLPYAPPEVPVAHDVLVDKVTGAVYGAEIGIQRGHFSGTDALPSPVIEKAIPWVATMPYPTLYAEGARLANVRFLLAAAEHYEVTLALLDHPDAETWRKQRARRVPGPGALFAVQRLDADRALADKLADTPGFRVLRGHPDELYPYLAAVSLSA